MAKSRSTEISLSVLESTHLLKWFQIDHFFNKIFQFVKFAKKKLSELQFQKTVKASGCTTVSFVSLKRVWPQFQGIYFQQI